MTKSNLFKNALMMTAFFALAACAGNNGEETNLASGVEPDDTTIEQPFDSSAQSETPDEMEMVQEAALSSSQKAAILRKYDHLDRSRVVPTKALQEAVLYFDQNKSKLRNQSYISILDFGKRSSVKRFHIIDMKSGSVWSVHVAHGKGSDSNHDGYAEKFSNRSGSHASSLGYYITGSTYNGSNGLSLRLDGKSSTNSAARGRAIVIHGANYVKDSNRIQGRSWGCPAISRANYKSVISKLKGGSLIYAVK